MQLCIYNVFIVPFHAHHINLNVTHIHNNRQSIQLVALLIREKILDNRIHFEDKHKSIAKYTRMCFFIKGGRYFVIKSGLAQKKGMIKCQVLTSRIAEIQESYWFQSLEDNRNLGCEVNSEITNSSNNFWSSTIICPTSLRRCHLLSCFFEDVVVVGAKTFSL